MTEVKWIVLNGNPLDGFKFYGAFETATQASEYGYANFEDSGFYIGQLETVKESNHD